jgi:hypothetical protein
MRTQARLAGFALVPIFGVILFVGSVRVSAADSNPALPPVIQAGFDSWAKGGGVEGAIYLWQKGGLLEGSNRAAEASGRLHRASQNLGSSVGWEQLKMDSIGKSSLVLYLSLNFQRGAVYARFLLYHTDKNWVVQDMDFSTRPETIMPWLSFAGERSLE